MSKRIAFTISVFFAAFLLALTTVPAQEVRFVPPRPAVYPNPKAITVPRQTISGTAPAPVHQDRYAGVSERERLRRIWEEQCNECCGHETDPAKPCPLCTDDPMTPCGKCPMCKAGFPCEMTLCRHCVQQRSQNMCNSCDLSAGDEPCGTCDACREHRSDPCEHADDGHGIRGEFNPYKEPRFLSVIPRPILDTYNNGARKFPVYYNPAPYYRPHWNPSLFTGYARPYTFRWSCSLCFKDPCQCDKPGLAGQVPYAYACKFCNRNPCACAEEICNVNKEMNPKGRSLSLADERKTSTRIQDKKEPEKKAPALKDAEDDIKKLFDEDDPLPMGDAPAGDSGRRLSDGDDDDELEKVRPRPLIDRPEPLETLPRRTEGVVN